MVNVRLSSCLNFRKIHLFKPYKQKPKHWKNTENRNSTETQVRVTLPQSSSCFLVSLNLTSVMMMRSGIKLVTDVSVAANTFTLSYLSIFKHISLNSSDAGGYNDYFGSKTMQLQQFNSKYWTVNLFLSVHYHHSCGLPLQINDRVTIHLNIY